MSITTSPLKFAMAGIAAMLLGNGIASAQTYGFATMQPGTLNHTTGTAVAKVLKEKAGMNVLVQPTAGESGARSRWSAAARSSSASPIFWKLRSTPRAARIPICA